MESFPLRNAVKNEQNILNMDYDSGYMSHHQESNSDTSMECNNVENSENKQVIYLSEDALLEKPSLCENNMNLSLEIENEDYEQTRRLFFSSPDLMLGSSVESRKTTYSGLENDSQLSVEIPESERIVVDSKYFDEVVESPKSPILCAGSPILIESRLNRNYFKSPIIENSDNDRNTTNSAKPIKKLTLVFSKTDESKYSVKRKFPSLSPLKKTSPSPLKQILTPDKKTDPMEANISPDLFEEEIEIVSASNEVIKPLNYIAEERYINRKDQRLIKRVQNGLSGVLPPPSVTRIEMSVQEMLEKIQNNKSYFWDCESNKEANNASLNSSGDSPDGFKSLLENVEAPEKFENKKFPEVLQYRFHGLHHNRSKLSEELEDLYTKYFLRFVGSETQSTCTAFSGGSPSRRRGGDARPPRWQAKSPGRRLSHLARRRITFSGTGGAGGSRARQILVDARKLDLLGGRKSPRKTPKKTPRKSPRGGGGARTPSSSAKRKLAMRFRELSGEIEKSVPSTSSENTANKSILGSPALSESSRSSISSTSSLPIKRELFPSQNKEKNTGLMPPASSGLSRRGGTSSADSSKPRRALFVSPSKSSPRKGKNSPFKKSPLKHLCLGYEKKRKRSDFDDSAMPKDAKVARSEMEKETGPARSRSEMILALNRSGSAAEMSDMQKKRLQWAVYEALRSQNITPTHPQFKVFASVLARVTRHFLSVAPRQDLTTVAGDKMLRVARTHVFAVSKGKSVDEVIGEYKRSRTRVEKPQGYVGIEEFNSGRKPTGGPQKVLRDRSNTMESWEKRKMEQAERAKGAENRVEKIRKVINFDNR